MSGPNVCELPERARAVLADVPVEILCAEARAQEAHFVRGEPSQDAAGVELFRRAIAENDDEAWAAVVCLYRGLLLAHAGRQVIRKLVGEDGAFCVDRAFQRFWQATHGRGIHEFQDLASILTYLKMCLASVLLDEARARRRQACISIDALSPEASVSGDPSAGILADLGRRELWAVIASELRTDPERLVARLSFVVGLSPREICARHPQHFAVADVYRLKRNMIDRLRRSAPLRALLDLD